MNAVLFGRLGELWTLNIGLLWLNGDETGTTLAPFCARCSAAYCVLSGPNDLCTKKHHQRAETRELTGISHKSEPRRAAARTWCVSIRGAVFLVPSKAENCGNEGSSLAADRNDISAGAAQGLLAKDQSIAGTAAAPK